MKKIILMVLFIVALSSPAWATWSTIVQNPNYGGHYYEFEIACIGDGSALSATDISKMSGMTQVIKDHLKKCIFLYMDIKVVEAPDAAYTITITDHNGISIYAHEVTTYASSTTGYDLSEDTSYPWRYPAGLNLAIGDIGSNLDAITLVFHCWIQDELR